MLLRSTLRAGLVVAAVLAYGAALPVAAAPGKATAKPAKKMAVKPVPAKTQTAGKTPSETVSRLIAAMKKRDKAGISGAFNWKRFADEMNKLIPDGKGLDAATYKTLLVETLNVEPAVSNNLRVGQETKKGADTATVEMRRVFPSGSGKSATNQVRTINVLTLGKEKDALWRIFRLDSAGQAAPTAAPKPMVPRAPQGMVPAAGAEPTKH
jgi:hypothetical protein